MPDDRPVSPEERLRAFIAERREGLTALDRRSAFFEREYRQGFRACLDDLETNVVAALSTPAGPSPEPCPCCKDERWPCDHGVTVAAPSPREEAVEAALWDLREQVAREIAESPCRIDADHLAHIDSFIHRAIPRLSAARPSFPTPESPHA